MIPNEMKSWREVMDDVARLTKERDEALAEIARMREIESDDLRAARDDAIRLGKERDEARAEVERHRQTAHTLECDIRDARANRDKYKAEVARLRASQNERAIAELVWVAGMMHGGVFDPAWTKARVGIGDRIAALRAEQAAAPAPVTPPADAPQRPSIGAIEDLRDFILEDWRRDDHGPDAIDRLQRAVRLLLDDALAARGGAQ